MNADEKREKMVERVRHFFAKAASTDFPEEAEAFESRALRLMAEYEIAERELRDAGDYQSDIIDLTHFGRGGKGAAALACWLADGFGAYGVLWSVGDGKAGRVKITGTPSQLEQLNLLLDHLLPQLRADLTRDKPRSRMSYSLGWAQRVSERVKAAQVQVYSDCQALVPTNTEAQRAYEEENGRARSSRADVSMFDTIAGKTAGNNADINQARITA